MEKAGSAPVCRLLQLSLVSFVSLLGGCLPQGDGEGGAPKQAYAFSGSQDSGTVNRSEKGDALLAGAATVPGPLLERTVGRSDQASRKTEPLTQTAPAAAQDSPSFAPVDDMPATDALGSFFRALSALEKGHSQNAVTILHLGDSHIAADRFSGDLREQFQSRFGNAGRGMLMPGLYLARGVKFDQGGKWQAALSTGSTPGPYGLTGAKVFAKGREDWLRLTATDRPFSWTEVTLQTGPDEGSAVIALDGDTKLVPANAPAPGWKTIRLEKSAREIVIRPKGDGLVTVHGVAIGEQRPGVRYVNLGLPGATATTPLSWNADELAADLQRISPNLLVLGYGTEESFEDTLNIREYETKVTRMLGTLRQAAPGASLLVIGPPDVARLPNFASGTNRTASDVCRALSPQERANYAQRVRNGDLRLARWHPPIRLEDVRQALRRAAAANQAYFWDWSKMMGGTCGIHAWVHSEPPLAANDHVHLTEEGSKRSARFLFRELMTAYDLFDRPIAAVENVAPQPPAAANRAARKSPR
jgi:lysophospholipase L1-like esterase